MENFDNNSLQSISQRKEINNNENQPDEITDRETLQYTVSGKADWIREKKFRSRIHNSNKKYLKSNLKG